MDPFGYGGQHGGGRFGMPNQYEPPRPAPNADGWSSGEDFLGWNESQDPRQDPRFQQLQQQQQQQQHHQQQHGGQPPPNRHPQHDPRQGNPQWNIGASEF